VELARSLTDRKASGFALYIYFNCHFTFAHSPSLQCRQPNLIPVYFQPAICQELISLIAKSGVWVVNRIINLSYNVLRILAIVLQDVRRNCTMVFSIGSSKVLSILPVDCLAAGIFCAMMFWTEGCPSLT